MSQHSVKQHLNVAAESYDAVIRSFVPHYDELLTTGVRFLKNLVPPKAKIIDLGGGTGGLTAAIVRGILDVHVELVDIDPQMLEQAKVRLAAFNDRVSFRLGSFHDPLPRCDGIVASLSLHHVHDLSQKTRLYSSIHKALAPGGVFLCLDATVSQDKRLNALTFEDWAAFMGEQGIAPADAKRHFADWAEEDRYFPLHEELKALERAGFPQPECFWRRGPLAVYGAAT